MAAPTPTTRQTPVGIFLRDGFRTKITFANDPDLSMWEKSVKLPGMDGGEPIDTTTMWNDEYRTMAFRQLITMTPSTGKAAFDPDVYNQLRTQLNVEQAFTKLLPDGSKLIYFGALTQFEFDEMSEGTFPEASFTITPSNWDPVSKVEAGPVLTSVAGT